MSKLVKNKSKYQVIGLMSGTSLDGVDVALCEFEYDQEWKFTCLRAKTYPYPAPLRHQLADAVTYNALQLAQLDISLGRWYGEQVNAFREGIHKPDFIASHGHTIFHQPDKNLTVQIGSGWELVKATGLPVINDFRSKDVSLGGQGAPLVPIGDRLLFGAYTYCLNLGGIANISYEQSGKRKAYDIAPCNMVLDRLARKKGLPFDQNGELAAKGRVNDRLLQDLDRWAYAHQDPPKSLGFEQVSQEVFTIIDDDTYSLRDRLATYAQYLAQRIGQAVHSTKKGKLLITGGGTHNAFLIRQIQAQLPSSVEIVLPDPILLDFKEAIVFGFLGVLRCRNENNCLASVTGASTDCSGGVIYE